MAIASHYVAADGTYRSDLSRKELLAARASGEGLVWIDVSESIGDAERTLLDDDLGFHELSIELLLEAPSAHVIRVEHFEDHLFVLMHGINYAAPASTIVETASLALFFGRGFVVSVHQHPLFSVDGAWRLFAEQRARFPSADLLAHRLLDGLITNIMPTVDALRDNLDNLEAEIIESPRRAHLETIIGLKRSALRLSRITEPQRVALERIAEREPAFVGDEASLRFRDLRDQMAMIDSVVRTLAIRSESALATYMSAVSIKQNESVKTLSWAALIFLPLALISGIYGMNFENMPELETEYGYFVVLAVMAAVLVGGGLWFAASRIAAIGREAATRARRIVVDPRRLVGYAEGLSHWPPRPGFHARRDNRDES